MNQKQNLLTVKEASKKANINQAILYTVMTHEKLEFETIGERKFIKEDVLESWIKNNVKKSTKENKEFEKNQNNINQNTNI